MPLRLGQEVQEVPRRLAPPEPPLADDAIRLEPLRRAHAPEIAWVIAGDPDIARFTLLPSAPGPDFLDRWLGRYEDGWENASAAGFAVRTTDDARLIGFAAYVHLNLETQEGEIGYVIDPAARGRGAATRSVELLTRWGFDRLELQRIELHIAPDNAASIRVAERAGYRLDGTLRNTHFKEGRRGDTAVWSRLPTD